MKHLTGKKELMINNFSGSVSYYDQHADVQRQAAEYLSRALKPWQYSVEEGPVLEIGAGTGFFTRHLLDMYKHKDVIISDASDMMVQFCRKKFGNDYDAEFRVLDAEQENWPPSTYALITGNYVVQWFKNPAATISKIAESLKSGGLMLISFPASESFPNWKKYCLELGLPYTGNTLPHLERIIVDLSMGPFKVDYFEERMSETFDSVFHFFKHLKQSGTSTNLTGKQLTVKQLRLLNKYWLKQNNGKVEINYHTALVAVKKDFDA